MTLDELQCCETFLSSKEVSLAIVYKDGNKNRKEEAAHCSGTDIPCIHGSILITEWPRHISTKVENDCNSAGLVRRLWGAKVEP